MKPNETGSILFLIVVGLSKLTLVTWSKEMSKLSMVFLGCLFLFSFNPALLSASEECGENVYEAALPSGKRQLRMLLASSKQLFDPTGIHTKLDFQVDSVIDLRTVISDELPNFDKCLEKIGAFVIVTSVFRMGAGARIVTGGKDLIVYAQEIVAHPQAFIDLSVPALALPKLQPKAAAGTPHGADGASGNPGFDGGSLTVFVGKKLFSVPKVVSLGGKGGQGGEGGNGENSRPGVKQPDNLARYIKGHKGERILFDANTKITKLPPVGEAGLYPDGSHPDIYNEGVVDEASVNGGDASVAGNAGKGGLGGNGGKGGNVSLHVSIADPNGLAEIKLKIEEKLELLGGPAGSNASPGTPGSGAPGGAGAVRFKYPHVMREYNKDGRRGTLYSWDYGQGKPGKDAAPGIIAVNPVVAAAGSPGTLTLVALSEAQRELWPVNEVPGPVLKQYLHVANSLFRSHLDANLSKANDTYLSILKYEPDLTAALINVRMNSLAKSNSGQNSSLEIEASAVAELDKKFENKVPVVLEALHRRGLLLQGHTYFGVSREFVPLASFEDLYKSYEGEIAVLKALDEMQKGLIDRLLIASREKIKLKEDADFKQLFNLRSSAKEVEIAENNVKRSEQLINRLKIQLDNLLKGITRETEYLEAVRQLIIINTEASDLTKATGIISQTGNSAAMGVAVGGPIGGVVAGTIGFLSSASSQNDQSRLAALQRRLFEQEKSLRELAQKNRIESINDSVMEQWALLKEASLQLNNSLNERMIAYQNREAIQTEVDTLAERGVRAISGVSASTIYDKYLHFYHERLARNGYELLKSLEYSWKIRLSEFEGQFALDLNKWEDFDRLRALIDDENKRLQRSRGRLGLDPTDLENNGYERSKLEVTLSEHSLPHFFQLLTSEGRTGFIRVDFEGKSNRRSESVRPVEDFVPFPRDHKSAEILSVDVWYLPKAQGDTKDFDQDCTIATHAFYLETSDREYFTDYFSDNIISFNTQNLHAGRDIEGRSSVALADVPGGSYENPSLDFIHTYLFRAGRPRFFSFQSPVRDWTLAMAAGDKFGRCLKEVKIIFYYRYLSNRFPANAK
jgi:hypothetical protein